MKAGGLYLSMLGFTSVLLFVISGTQQIHIPEAVPPEILADGIQTIVAVEERSLVMRDVCNTFHGPGASECDTNSVGILFLYAWLSFRAHMLPRGLSLLWSWNRTRLLLQR